MDLKIYFAAIADSLFKGKLTKKQVEGINALLAAMDTQGVMQARHRAYILATVYHETGTKMQPVAEIGRGKGKEYGEQAGPYKERYYGRGFSQLTWLENYKKVGRVLGVDLEQYPDKMLEVDIAAKEIAMSMSIGYYTGKKLSDYLNTAKVDPVNARRIVNGTDKAELIAGYYQKFLTASLLAK